LKILKHNKCFVQKLDLFFGLKKSEALKNRSLIKGGLLGGEAPNIIMGNKKRSFEI